MENSQKYIDLEDKYGAHNYHPLPVVLERGKGVHVWDVDNKKYYDFLSAYSAVNQGHCHPKIVTALQEQGTQLCLTSRAFHNSKLGPYEEFMTKTFGLDKLLPMNSGAEAVETAIKICRKWGYEKKGIKNGEAKIIVCGKNFHGRTISIISFSSDPDAKGHFGPYTPGFISIPYNDIESLRNIIKEHSTDVAGFLVEPIQGEAGVNVPDVDFIEKSAKLCNENNILFIADEIQTGLARTGSMLAICGDCGCTTKCERNPATYVKPDILILGKALSGGVYPVSAVLANNEVMDVLKPGQHGSTYGGNPLACHIAMAAMAVLIDEKLMVNARKMGQIFRAKIKELCEKYTILKSVRGRGLLNAILINDTPESKTAWNICLIMAENGLLAKPTHGNIIRFAPPLVITEDEINDCCNIIERSVRQYLDI